MCLLLYPQSSKDCMAISVLWKWDLVTQQKSACGHSIRKVLPGLSSLSPCHPQGPAPTVYLPGQMTSLVSWVTGALQPFSPGCAGSQPSRASQAFVVASQGVCEMLDAVEAPCCQERSETGASEPPHTCRATCPLPRHSPTPTSRLTVVSELRFLYVRN